jgi:GNAT superfamily N-acetyltransferase
MLSIYNLNDLTLSADQPRLVKQISQELKNYYSKYVTWTDADWENLVQSRLNTNTDGIPSTFIILDEELDSKKFVGTISVERGCEEINEKDGVWINGLLTQESYRNRGISLLLLKNLLDYFTTIDMKVFSLYALDNPRLDEFYQSIGVLPVGESIIECSFQIYPVILRQGNTQDVLENVYQRLKQSKYNELPKLSVYPKNIINEANKESLKLCNFSKNNLQTLFPKCESGKSVQLLDYKISTDNKLVI